MDITTNTYIDLIILLQQQQQERMSSFDLTSKLGSKLLSKDGEADVDQLKGKGLFSKYDIFEFDFNIYDEIIVILLYFSAHW